MHRSSWLGLVVESPRIGHPLKIERSGARDVRLSSPVANLVSFVDGVLVQTRRSRYFIDPAGNAYLIVSVTDLVGVASLSQRPTLQVPSRTPVVPRVECSVSQRVTRPIPRSPVVAGAKWKP